MINYVWRPIGQVLTWDGVRWINRRRTYLNVLPDGPEAEKILNARLPENDFYVLVAVDDYVLGPDCILCVRGNTDAEFVPLIRFGEKEVEWSDKREFARISFNLRGYQHYAEMPLVAWPPFYGVGSDDEEDEED